MSARIDAVMELVRRHAHEISGSCYGAANSTYREIESALAAPGAAPAAPLTACNCRWDGDTQMQQCTLHEAHVEAIHEWSERAKSAETALESVEASDMKREMLAIANAFIAGQKTQPEAPAVPEGWKHAANEWADMAINGLGWVRNIAEGISDASTALDNLEVCLKHCRKVNDAIYNAAAPAAPAVQAPPPMPWDEIEDIWAGVSPTDGADMEIEEFAHAILALRDKQWCGVRS